MLVTSVGILVADIIAADLPKVSNPGELTFTESGIQLHIGGHAANLSINLRKLNLKEGEVSSIGAIGDDLFGEYIENLLNKHGVISHLQRVPGVSTSKDLILVVKGQDRRFHVEVGANWYLKSEHVLSILEKEEPLVLYLGGVGLMGEFDQRLPEILPIVKRKGCVTFLDPVTPYKRDWDIISRALGWIDIFHCNNLEATKITGEKDPEKAALNLLSKGAKLVIISLGKEGLVAVTSKTIFKIPAFKVSVVDPTGAGDAFCAGVIYGLLRASNQGPINLDKLSLEQVTQALLEGEAAGASSVSMVGTTTGVTKENVDKLLNDQGPLVLNNLRLENF